MNNFPVCQRSPFTLSVIAILLLSSTSLSAESLSPLQQSLQELVVEEAIDDPPSLFTAGVVRRGESAAITLEDGRIASGLKLVELGSVTKLFTWASLLVLASRGDLSFSDSVTDYVGDTVAVDPTLQVAHLMTHSGGFDDRVLGIYTHGSEYSGSPAPFLAERDVPSVRAPGLVTVYSNYGSALAAHVVERASGMPFDEFLAKEFFRPLEMSDTGFAATPSAFGHGYDRAAVLSGRTRQIGAGGLVSSVADMNRFMRYLLGSGLLAPVTAGSGRVGYGFWNESLGDHRVLMHAGDTLGYSSILAVLPEHETGVFIAYNRLSHSLRMELASEILARVVNAGGTSGALAGADDPAGRQAIAWHQWAWETRPSAGTGLEALADPRGVAGSYRSLRFPHRSPAKLISFGNVVRVRAVDAGIVEVDGGVFSLDAAGAFTSSDSSETVVFGVGPDGTRFMARSADPTTTYEAIGALDLPAVHVVVLIASLVAFFTSVGAVATRRTGSADAIAAAATAVVGLGVVTTAAIAAVRAQQMVFGLPAALTAAFWLGRAFVIAELVTVVLVAMRVGRREPLHVAPVALVVVGFAFSWFLFYWNLV